MSKPLAVLFQKSLDTGIVPNDWKLADVAPVFKKGDRKLPSNYRLISLTPLICKVLESVIRDKMFDYLLHGFMPRRSCVTQLLTALHYWTESLEKGIPVDVLYLDFSRAFDSVPHERLLLKLEAYGIQGKVLQWIRSFLSQRKQAVVINGVKSATSNVISGVPQGSVIGQSNFQLEQDLLLLKEWSMKWLLNFNIVKTFVMHLGNSNPCHTYYMNGQPLQVVSEHQDLGIIVDSSLKFHSQATSAINKANRVLGLIKKSFNTLNRKTLPILYKALVRPHSGKTSP